MLSGGKRRTESMTLPSGVGGIVACFAGKERGDENPARLLIEVGYHNSHRDSRAKNQVSRQSRKFLFLAK
jgi:hypothetical protein